MGDYKYVSPLEKGYKQFKLTKEQHNKLFKYRKRTWVVNYEYYYNDHVILLHGFTSKRAVFMSTIIFPAVVLLNGLANFKDIWKELRDLYKQKESGTYIIDRFRGEKYKQVMDIIQNQ